MSDKIFFSKIKIFQHDLRFIQGQKGFFFVSRETMKMYFGGFYERLAKKM